MSRVTRKPGFAVTDEVKHKRGCATAEDSLRLDILDVCNNFVAKIKALISCAVTVKLICTFAFRLCKISPSFIYGAAHISGVQLPCL